MPMRWSALISLVTHFILVLLISLLLHPKPIQAQEEVIPVRLLSYEQALLEAPAVRVTAARIAPAPGPAPQPSRFPAGGVSPEAPRAKQPPAPPKVLTAQGGETKVPEGRPGATGTEGTGEEPAGPTYGPGVTPGPLPVYPKHALDQNLEGTVTLAVTIRADGKIAVAVSGSSGHSVLDEAARRAVSRWSFTPGMERGKLAEGTVTVRIRFAQHAVEQL